MTSDSLAKLYAEVVKVRPEAAVPQRGEGWFHLPLNLLHVNGRWWWTNSTGEGKCVYDTDAEAIILHHWLSMLPPNTAPMKRPDGKWRVVVLSSVGQEHGWAAAYGTLSDSQLESLANYLKSTGTEGGA